MTRSPLRCCTSIIRSSVLVQASSSLSIGRTRAWTREATRNKNPFTPFFVRVFCDSIAIVVQGRMCEVEWVWLNYQRDITGHSKGAWVVHLNHTGKTELFQSPCGAHSVGQPSTLGNQAFHGIQLFPSLGVCSILLNTSSCSGVG